MIKKKEGLSKAEYSMNNYIFFFTTLGHSFVYNEDVLFLTVSIILRNKNVEVA